MPKVLDVLSASWSPFRMVDVSGNAKKMLELRLVAKAKLGEGTALSFTANGGMLDEEELDKGLRGDETFLLGFWLPSNIESENLALKVLSGEGDILEEICLNPKPHAINPFPPLRLDKLGLNLPETL